MSKFFGFFLGFLLAVTTASSQLTSFELIQAVANLQNAGPGPAVFLRLSGDLDETSDAYLQLPHLYFESQDQRNACVVQSIHYDFGDNPNRCDGANCLVPLQDGAPEIQHITFWADSTCGDSSPKYAALLRQEYVETIGWRVQVLSSQWVGASVPAMALEWQAFPPAAGMPVWLETPTNYEGLTTAHQYHYLAGKMILANIVDASTCADGGLLPNQYASPCGLEAANAEVAVWQNQFDAHIYQNALETQLSPILMKRLLAQESQFWPGEYELSPAEFGLGRVTHEGADTTLLWNPQAFDQYCAAMFIDDVCGGGYNSLPDWAQDNLRGALLSSVDATCPTCELGVDLDKAAVGIEVVAQSLVANAAQVGQIISNVTGLPPGESVSYLDLWRFTLVNYNAGPGCLYHAVLAAHDAGRPLNWQNVSGQLAGDCGNAVDYVARITG